MERSTLPARCLPFPSLLRLKARTFAVLCPVRFCGHPDFYCMSGFADTALFTACPLLWTPRFYCLSTFVDTSNTRQRKIPIYWNFYSVSLGTILSCFNSRVKWYLTLVLFAALKQVCQLVTYTSTCCYTLSSRVK